MRELTEQDLAAIARIQELKGCTLDWARQSYRQQCQKLADPDIETRHEIILDSVQRSIKEPVKAEEEAPKKMTRSERRLATKEKKAQKKAAKKAEHKERAKVELVPLSRDVELKPAGEDYPHIFTANLFGRKHAVAFMEAGHDELGSTAPPHFSEKRIATAKKFSKDSELPLAYCVAITVKEKPEQGYAVPEDLFKKFSSKMSRGRVSLSLSAEARDAFAADGLVGVRFAQIEPEAKAA